MAADSYRIIIKPSGILLIGVICTAAVAVALMQKGGGHQEPALKPVGGTSTAAPAAPAAAGAAAPADEPMSTGEIEEKKMLQDWNQDAAQARDWLFLGPLSAGSDIKVTANDAEAQAQMVRIVNTVYLPQEAKYQAKENATFDLAGKTYAWRKFHGSAFDFKDIFTSPTTPMNSLKNVVVYAVTNIDSPKSEKKLMHFRSDDGAIVWLNGTQVFKTTKIRGVREEDQIPVHLRSGKNTLLIKVGQGTGGWGMMVHLEDAAGAK